MSRQTGQEEWGLVCYKKKAQFNQYIELKTKSFQYQKVLGRLYFAAAQDDESSRKQMSKLIKGLDGILQQLKSTFSQIYQQMRFLKMQSLASLIESFQQLLGSIHHYTIESFKSRLEYGNHTRDKEEELDERKTCQKCMGSIEQLNLKRLYEEITTTSTSLQDDGVKMTKEQRRKMISELDEYDILLAEKENYLRKVNAVLENKGRVGELSSHDKTYNFLSQYLSQLEKIQERRAKSTNKSDPIIEQQDRKWQQQSYKHILQYIKRVLFQHFVNQCSGPVKKMFQKINLDKIFKSFGDQGSAGMRMPVNMQNHETQTMSIPEIEQVKVLQKKMEFKLKQTAMLKANKDELEKKYMSTLDLKRKVEGDMFELKRDRKWLQSEAKTAQQSLKALTQKSNQSLKNYQEDQRRTIERYINQRERIIKASKTVQNQYRLLEQEHRKCLQTRNKQKQVSTQQAQTEVQLEIQIAELTNYTNQQSFSQQQMMPLQGKRRESKFNKLVFKALKDKKNISLNKQATSVFQAWKMDPKSYRNQQEDSLMAESIKAECNLQIQHNVINLKIISSSLYQQPQQNNSPIGKKIRTKPHNKLKNTTSGRHQTTQQLSPNTQTPQRTYTQGNQERNLSNSSKDRRIKLSMTSFKKIYNQSKPQVLNQNQHSNYKFSNFIRFTEGDQSCNKDTNQNIKLSDEINVISEQCRKASIQELKGQMASERLYSKRKRHQPKQLPFQRVVQNGKERFYIKKISCESINFKKEKERIKEISQILKPYVYNNNVSGVKGRQSRAHLKTIRQRLSDLSEKKIPVNSQEEKEMEQISINNEASRNLQQEIAINSPLIGNDILSVQHIIQNQYAYLKAVGFIDFILKMGKQNKKIIKAINKIQNEVKQKFTAHSKNDLQLFGGMDEAEHYIRGNNFWTIDNMKENLMIYNKNDGLSIKVQKYFTLLKRANPELYGVLMRFLLDPIFAVFGNKVTDRSEIQIDDNGNFVRELFNQLQKYHKIKHNDCTHIIDFLEKIGFYKYTYF